MNVAEQVGSTGTNPRELIERIPELGALTSTDPKLRQAIAWGSPMAVYRRLLWLRRAGKLSAAERPIVDALLARRRPFVEPLVSAPPSVSTNGFGPRLRGESEKDPADGTYLSTCWMTLFFLPIVPLGSYLVADSTGPTGRRAWTFLGRAPLAQLHYLWVGLFGLLAFSAVGVGSGIAFIIVSHPDVYFVNGLQTDVDVVVDGITPIHIPAQGTEVRKLSAGKHQLEVSANGRKIDTDSIEVHMTKDLSAYNVLGAALVYDRSVTYSEVVTQLHQDSPPHYHCGERFIEVAKVDYPFVEPPPELKIKSGESNVKQHVGRVVAEHGCSNKLFSEGKNREAARLLAKEDEIEGFPLETHQRAVALLQRFGDQEDVVDLARKGLEDHDDSLPHHRMFQDAMLRAARGAELLEIYAKRQSDFPDAPDAAYLLARVQENPDHRRFIELRRRFPQHPSIAWAAAYDLATLGDSQGVVDTVEALRAMDREVADDCLRIDAEALVSLGRAPVAARILKLAFQRNLNEDKVNVAKLYGYVAGVTPSGPSPTVLLESIIPGKGDHRTEVAIYRARILLGAPLAKEHDGKDWTEGDVWSLKLESAAMEDPARALALVDQGSELNLLTVSRETWQLLYGEAERLEPGGERAQRLASYDPSVASSAASYLKSGAEEELSDLAPAQRAAFHLVRSRMTADSGERDRLLELARKEDVLHTAVTRATNQWPPPK